MSRFISAIILIFVSSFLNAQEINTEVGNSNKLTSLSDADSTTTMLPGTERPYTFGYSAPSAMSEEPTLAQDSLHLQIGMQLDSLERNFTRMVMVAEHLPEISDRMLAELNAFLDRFVGSLEYWRLYREYY